MKNNDLAMEIGRRGREKVESEFDIHKNARALLDMMVNCE